MREALDQRLKANKPNPFPADFVPKAEPQMWLETSAARLLSMKSSGDAKQFEADLASFQELANKLIAFSRDSAGECCKLIERKDKKVKASKDAETRRAELAKEKALREQDAQNQKKVASAAAAKQTGSIPVLSMKHASIVEMATYDDLDSMKKAVSQGNLSAGLPYNVKAHTTLRTCVEHRAVKSSLEVFRIQCPFNLNGQS